ncbi:hypothetical protein L6R52_00565 [Myxococcota bacterium]|nr:hypothetical protein [Myxococcota bacterium]
MTSTILILALLATSAPTSTPEATFKSAIEDFEFGEHASAAAKLRTILEPPKLSSKEDLIVARQYLGACYHLLDEKEKAKAQFSLLLALDPKHKLDPEVFSPAVVAFFEQVRDEAGFSLEGESSGRSAGELPPKKKRLAEGDARTPGDGAGDVTKKGEPKLDVVRPAPHAPPAALALIPFGVGQFANRHPVKGALFAAGEVGLFTTAALTYVMFEGLKRPDGLFEEADQSRAESLQTVYLTTFWAGIGLTAIGIVEALISYPGDNVAPASAGRATVSVGPTGLAIGF